MNGTLGEQHVGEGVDREIDAARVHAHTLASHLHEGTTAFGCMNHVCGVDMWIKKKKNTDICHRK